MDIATFLGINILFVKETSDNKRSLVGAIQVMLK
jgi:hypothetical protein